VRILIVESDTTLSKSISETLTQEGYQNDVAENMGDAKYFIEIRNYDLVLLSWPIANENSLDIIPTVKTEAHKTSIIVLSERMTRQVKSKHSSLVLMITSRSHWILIFYLFALRQNFVLVSPILLKLMTLLLIPKRKKLSTRVKRLNLKASHLKYLHISPSIKTKLSQKNNSLMPLGRT